MITQYKQCVLTIFSNFTLAMKSCYNLTYFYEEIKKEIRKCLTLFFMRAITKMIVQEKYSGIRTAFSREIE